MLIKQIDREWLPFANRLLAIHAPTGAWIILDKSYRDVVSEMEKTSDIESIINKFPNLAASEILDLLKVMRNSESRIQETLGAVQKNLDPLMLPSLAVAKLTERCNLNCSYCYIEAGCQKKGMMDEKTAIRIVDEFIEMHKNDRLPLNYSFHGGEPLLNFEIMKKVTEYAKPYRDRLTLSIQTNGTLITDEIAEFLKENKIDVGVSIDGPQFIQDASRYYLGGKGSFEHVMRGIKILQKHKVNFGAISVLNGLNAKYINETINFFLENKIYAISFSPIQKNGRGKDDSNYYVDGDTIFEAYKVILDRVLAHNKTHDRNEWIAERILSNLIQSIYFNKKTFMCMDSPCGAARKLLGIDVHGNFYACDNFTGDKDFLIGSLEKGHIKDQLLESPIRKKAASRCKENIKRCKDCIWRGICGGLCYSADYYSGIKEEDETEVCSFYKKIIPYLIGRIAEDPNIPYLVDREFEETKWRNIFISLGSSNNEVMDEELFEALLKVHNINDKCILQVCTSKISNCADFSKILNLLKEKNITYNLITNDEAIATSESYNLLASANIQAVQVDFTTDGKSINPLIKKFTECRKGKECKIPLYISLVHSPDSLEKTFSDLENLELDENDVIILSNSSDTEKGYETLNILLITLNERGFSKHVKLSSIAEDKLWKKNLIFVLNKTDNDTSCLQIGLDCLAGKTLEQAPPNII
ncbi:MAG: radical SAM protein [Fibrobacter sp.]|uniref:radical SAM/SPASM domain-containing protein n=1 Tax=Fibrobacter sp. TaxID=35828 RepID=UPI001AFE6EB7|nr:radical SAM protein [Fibrobacter sp.]MBO7059943.1 radical SAM protein [Fibrobacter sp.]